MVACPDRRRKSRFQRKQRAMAQRNPVFPARHVGTSTERYFGALGLGDRSFPYPEAISRSWFLCHSLLAGRMGTVCLSQFDLRSESIDKRRLRRELMASLTVSKNPY